MAGPKLYITYIQFRHFNKHLSSSSASSEDIILAQADMPFQQQRIDAAITEKIGFRSFPI